MQCLLVIAALPFAWLAQTPGSAAADASVAASTANRTIPAKVLRYSRRLIERYDADGDGRLASSEWQKMRGNPHSADLDGDDLITVDEFSQHVANYGRQRKLCLVPPPSLAAGEIPPLLHPVTSSSVLSEPDDGSAITDPDESLGLSAREYLLRQRRFHVSPKRLPAGLPQWFIDLDADGDGQLTELEYAPQQTITRLEQFARYDVNGDGLMTADEYVRAVNTKSNAKVTGGSG